MREISNRATTEMADGLNILLHSQLELQVKAYDLDPEALTGDDRAEFIRWNMLALIRELGEALEEVGWKPWAESRHVNKEAFAGELVDGLHFFANLCLAAGVTGEDLAVGYRDKRVKNLQRQVEGYTGVKEKCFNCKRAYDDSETRCRPRTRSREPFCQEWEHDSKLKLPS